MNRERLNEIRNHIVRLPVLESRLTKLKEVLLEAEQEERHSLKKLNKETVDVEKLKEENISVVLLRLIGKYDNKLDKENTEMLQAKWDYDQIVERIRGLKKDEEDLQERILQLKQDKRAYELELEKRESDLLKSVNEEVSVQYRTWDDEQNKLRKQMIEIDEAISAALRAQDVAKRAIKEFESARQWATYDAWTNGGIISHMAKYDKIDGAQEEVNRLTAQLSNLNKELMDVEGMSLGQDLGINHTTRAFDFWFDNIFTDLRVRDKISEDQNKVQQVAEKIHQVIQQLHTKRQGLQWKIEQKENQKEELLVNYK